MFISHRLRFPKVIIALFVLEFIFTVPILALFGIASPNLYRTALWQDGSDNGFNSNPNEILYAYANYKPISVPLVWSQFVTDFNVVIAVLSMFLLLVKAVMFILHVFHPLLSVLVHLTLAALYAVSIHAQAASDMSDSKHPQHGPPWYITRSCSVAHNRNNVHYCQQAKAAFAVTCIMLALWILNSIVAIYSLIPTKSERAARATSVESVDSTNFKGYHSPGSDVSNQQQWEMQSFPPPPTKVGDVKPMKTPMTPRTVAFHTLGGNGPAFKTGK
ncbi:MAG: hypothetical protein M1827_000986 [Pycnora praestabilis]|nr:MAG: hypothetical protein M1827_000986 [Pycnora praestabilis]